LEYGHEQLGTKYGECVQHQPGFNPPHISLLAGIPIPLAFPSKCRQNCTIYANANEHCDGTTVEQN
jgi:hypothetical protein